MNNVGWGCVALVLIALGAGAQKPRLVKDINPQITPTHSSPRPGHGVTTTSPQSLVRVLDTTYFVADDPLRGTELFLSKGVPGSTKMAEDIRYGGGDSWPGDFATDGLRLYFSADNGLSGRELWIAEPLFDKVRPLADINSRLGKGSNPVGMYAHGGLVYFSATDLGVANHEPWVTDGTTAGTRKLKEIVPSNTLGSNPSGFFGYRSRVYFQAFDGGARRLWRTDGTAAGTVVVGGVTLDAGHAQMVLFQGQIYFAATTPASGLELFRMDPTTESIQLAHDLYPGSGSSNPNFLTVVGGYLYFVADGVESGAVFRSGNEVWSTDGSGLRLFDLNAGHRGSNPREVHAYNPPSANPVLLVTASGVLPGTQQPTGYELWKIDQSGFDVYEIAPGNSGSTPRGLTVGPGGKCYFSAFSPLVGREMFETDGSAAGTKLFKQLNIYGDPNGSDPAFFSPLIQGNLLFSCDNGPDGRELWVSDGTDQGTVLVADIHPRAKTTRGSTPSLLSAIGGGVCFTARTGSAVTRPLRTLGVWISDGTTGGTLRLPSLDRYGLANADEAAVLGGKLFVAGTGNDRQGAGIGYELWSLDRRTGVVEELDIRSGAAGSLPMHLTVFGHLLYFSAIGDPGPGGEFGRELWVSDGTTAGTRMVADLNVGGGSSNPDHFYVYQGRLFFAARDSAHGEELWMCSAPGAAPIRLSDLYPGVQDGQPHGFRGLGERLLFVGTSATGGREPQVLDFRTWQVTTIDVRGGAEGSMARSTETIPFTVVGQEVYFAADGDLNRTGSSVGVELWKSDGTVLGTELVTDVWPGPKGSQPGGVTQIGDTSRVMFFASTGAGTSRHYDGLWVSDGTNTFTLQRLPSGWRGTGVSRSGRLGSRYAFAQVPYYSAATDQLGTDVFVSDGTLAGTALVCRDFYATSLNEAPTDALLAEDGRLFMVRVHADYGAELWVLDELGLAASRGAGCAVAGNAPVLCAEDPVLGQDFGVELEFPNAGMTAGVLMVGMWEPVPIPLGACALHVQPFGPVVFRPLATDVLGRWRGVLSTQRGVLGLRYAVQAALRAPSGQPAALTNAVVLSPGIK